MSSPVFEEQSLSIPQSPIDELYNESETKDEGLPPIIHTTFDSIKYSAKNFIYLKTGYKVTSKLASTDHGSVYLG